MSTHPPLEHRGEPRTGRFAPSDWSAMDEHRERHVGSPDGPDGTCVFCLEDAPKCEQCGQPEEDWPEMHLNDADQCDRCTMAWGYQHFAPYHLLERWHAKGGHCLCEECAPPRTKEEDGR